VICGTVGLVEITWVDEAGSEVGGDDGDEGRRLVDDTSVLEVAGVSV